MSSVVHRSPNKLWTVWISNSIFNLYAAILHFIHSMVQPVLHNLSASRGNRRDKHLRYPLFFSPNLQCVSFEIIVLFTSFWAIRVCNYLYGSGSTGEEKPWFIQFCDFFNKLFLLEDWSMWIQGTYVVSKKSLEKNFDFNGILKATKKSAGSWSEIQWYGSADLNPDPYENVTDLEHCKRSMSSVFFTKINYTFWKQAGFLINSAWHLSYLKKKSFHLLDGTVNTGPYSLHVLMLSKKNLSYVLLISWNRGKKLWSGSGTGSVIQW